MALSKRVPKVQPYVIRKSKIQGKGGFATRLGISARTIEGHLNHVFSKLGINSRVELARLARDYEMA